MALTDLSVDDMMILEARHRATVTVDMGNVPPATATLVSWDTKRGCAKVRFANGTTATIRQARVTLAEEPSCAT